jgi:tetratricopeptide (TPR) repeat protein
MNTKPSEIISGSAESKAGHLPGYPDSIELEFLPRFRALIGNTYQQLTLLGCDLRPMANFIEGLRVSFCESKDTLAARGSLDTLIGWNKDLIAEPVLQDFRKNSLALLNEYWLAELQVAKAQSEEEAWALFVNRFAESLTYWRTKHCIWWAELVAGKASGHPSSFFAAEYQQKLEAFCINAHLMEQARWPEALPFIESELAGNTLLMPKTQAFMTAICGSIYLYHIDATAAPRWFGKAAEIAPSLPYLALLQAEVERVNWNVDAALSYLETHVREFPNDPEIYISMGQCHQYGKNDIPKAIECYDLATLADPGNLSGQLYKMAAWGSDAQLYPQHRNEFASIVQSLVLIDPEGELGVYISAGDACQRADDFDSAEKWFFKALEKEPGRPETIAYLGNLYRAIASKAAPDNAELIEKSASFYRKTIELAPHSTDGYWNMAVLLADVAAKKEEAAQMYETAILACPLFKKTLLVEAAKVYLALDNLPLATAKAMEALRLDPDFDYAMNTLHDIADKVRDHSYNESGEKHSPAATIAIYQNILELKKEAYEANFQNRAGNAYYYFEDYTKAVAHYQNAINANDKSAVYYDNLSGALEKLDRIEEAWAMSEMALSYDPTNSTYRKQAAELSRRAKSLRHFGVPMEQRNATVEPIRIRFVDTLLPYFVEDGNLLPLLQEKINAFRNRIEAVHGLSNPGIKFADDHLTIYETDNFSIELDGFRVNADFVQAGWYFATGIPAEDLAGFEGRFMEHPGVPEILWFEAEDMALLGEKAIKKGDYLDFILLILENVMFTRADYSDLLQYDSGIISERFIGESADFAAKFFQFNRMLIKFKVSIIQDKDVIFEVFKNAYDRGLTLQQTLNKLLEENPSYRIYLPVQRALREGRAEIFDTEDWQEEEILASIVHTPKGTKIWEVANVSPESAFSQLLVKAPDASTNFIRAKHPDVATVLNDIVPGCAFVSNWLQLPSSPESKTAQTNDAK